MSESPEERPGLREELGIEPPATLSGWLKGLEQRVTALEGRLMPPAWTDEQVEQFKAEWDRWLRSAPPFIRASPLVPGEHTEPRRFEYQIGGPGCPGCAADREAAADPFADKAAQRGGYRRQAGRGRGQQLA